MYNIFQITDIVEGRLIRQSNSKNKIKHLAYDSRKVQGDENVLFFALKTPKNDGHKYIEKLYNRGVTHFVVSEDFASQATQYPQADFVVTDNPLTALQKLAIYHRLQFDIPVIGITGSNGKTIVKEWLYQLLCPDKKIVYSPNSFNSQIGVPISVWQIGQDDQLGLFEAGISQLGEMNVLAEIIKPTVGIFTNIGTAHDESFIDIRQKTGEKLNLFRRVKTLIFSADHKPISEVLQRTELPKKVNLFQWSLKNKDVDLWVKSIEKHQNKTSMTAVFEGKEISLQIPFADNAAIENTIHCWACMLFLGYENDVIAKRLSMLTPIAMRLEMKQGINNCMIINDTYNSDVNSLQIALDLMNNQNQFRRKMVILSDILQSRFSESDLYREINNLLVSKQIDRMIGVGEAISRQATVFSMEKEFYPSTDVFLTAFNTDKINDEIVLVKGARRFNFERISNYLELKTHETILEVNLPNLIKNLNYYRSLLKSSTKIMVMVKAFAYGTGDIDVANVLQYHGVDYLAVAYSDEGVSLRNKNITLPIMVMNPEEKGIDQILRYRLQPEIYSLRVLSLLIDEMNSNPQTENVHIHVKIETGMNRLGFEEKDLKEALRQITANSKIIVESIFSHFAASDDPQSDDFTTMQVSIFNRCYDILTDGLGYRPLKHFSNTSAICRFPQYQFDMVRLGIGLYGINPFADAKKTAHVPTLKTVISQIKFISCGQTVGYNRKWTAQRDTVLATIPVGYADGFPRSAGNGAAVVWINGQQVKVVGNVCMDMCMLDVTDISVKEGDKVIIFGEDLPLSKLATASNRIEYEILTGISQRVKRIFIED